MSKHFTHHMDSDAVFSIEPHFDGVGEGFEFPTAVRGAGSVGTIDPPTDLEQRVFDRSFVLLSSEDQRAYLEWFWLHHFAGKSFYMPTWTNDFEPVAGVSSGGSTMLVKNNGFGSYYDRVAGYRVDSARSPWKYTSFGLLVVTRDLEEYYFKLGHPLDTAPASAGPVEPNAYIDNLDGTLTLNLKVVSGDQSFLQNYAQADIALASLILAVRSSAPSVQFSIKTTSKVEARQPFTQIFFESDFEPPVTGSGYALMLEDDLGGLTAVRLGGDNRIVLDDDGTLYKVRLEPDTDPPTGKLQIEDSGLKTISLTAI